MQLLYPAIWKADSTISLHQRMDSTPKDRKTGSQKVKQNFVKKCAIVSYFRRKSKASVPYKSTIWMICKVQFTPWIEFLFF
ncbi:MAG: hypothetical protein EGR19_07040 [Dialister sp.]|nr:hypothetical protein [Dialister sp.]